MRNKLLFTIFASIALSILSVVTVFAGTWRLDEKGWSWIRDNGTKAVSCWEWCDGNGDGIAECYCFSPEGYCYLDCITPDVYKVNKDGAWVENNIVQTKRISAGPNPNLGERPAIRLAKEKAKELGYDLKACYDWCAGGGISYVTDWNLNDENGIIHYAERGFTTGQGDCYDMACCLALMLRSFPNFSPKISVMSGYVPLRGGGVSPHCWVEMIEDGKTYVLDPDFEYERKTNGFKITYGQKGTWRYQNYHAMHD